MIYVKEISPPRKLSGLSSLVCQFDYRPDIVDALRGIPAAVYHKKDKIWEVPVNHLSLLMDTLTILDDITLTLWDQPEIRKISETDLTSNEIATFRYPPYNHQIEAINYGLRERQAPGWLLLDSMGLGKSYSIMCLAEALHMRGLIEHCLIITGVDSLRSNWKNECLKFSNMSAMVLGEKISRNGKVSYATIKERVEILKGPIEEFFVITNISALRDDAMIEAINKSGKFGMMAFDEAHRGSRQSQMGANLLKLKADYKVAATGTIITNNPQSAFVPLVWTGNDHATLTNFKSQYCEFGGFNGYQIVGYKNLDLLKDELDHCSLRRTLDQVRDDMPPKTVETELVEMSDAHKKFYDAIKNGVKEEANKVELNSNNLLALTTRLRQATACPSFLSTDPPDSSKVERCVEIVEDLLDQGEKVVILCTFKETVDVLASRFGKFGKFHFTVNTGDVPDDLVFRNIDQFQNDPTPSVFIGTWAKCSTGITLNAASYMICMDTPYTQAMFDQGCDRIWRVNSTRPAFIKVLICKDTIDERVWKIVETKRDLADYLVDGKETQQMQESLTREMRSIISDL